MRGSRGSSTAAARRRRNGLLLAGLLLATGAAGAAPVRLTEAERLDADGRATPVRLPIELTAGAGEPAPVRLHLRLRFELAAPASDDALFVPGLRAHARLRVNGQLLEDRLEPATAPLPRGPGRIRWWRLPAAFVHAGPNEVEIEAAGARELAISALQVGPAAEVEQAFDDRMLVAVVGPAMVALIIACLALSVLVLWARRRRDTLYGYFGVGALGWGLHSGWSVLPASPLQGTHHVVWWTSLYSFFVMMLVIFCVRFAGWRWRAFDRLVWALALLAPAALYGAAAAGALAAAASAWLLLCIAIVAVGLVGVSLHAWHYRDATSLLLLAAAAVSFAFGVRDWWVDHAGLDSNPVYLTPYAGLPFIALAAWMLVDGFVKASRELESVNARLEERVAQQHADLRRALAEMRQAKDAAEAADRAKSRFLAAASHDLRQPIHALGLYLGSIADAPAAAPVRTALARMGGSLSTLQAMLEALLDISRMDAGMVGPQFEAVDLDALLRRLGDEYGPLAERRGLRLVLRGPAGAPGLYAHTDPLLFERIVRNLLANAVQYTARGGVLLAWRLRRAPDGGRRWRVDVIDSGRGIAAAEQERVFEEFYRVDGGRDDAAPGLGLGLSIVRRLSRLMALEVDLRSAPGRGTRVALSLPCTAAAPQATTAPAADPLPGGRWIAVVDDDADVRAGMRSVLADWGCCTVDAASADALLAHWHDCGRPPVEAIVADLRLRAGATGLQAIERLRHAFGAAALPALVVTGETAAEPLQALTASALPWLSKPVPAARLRQWLASVLAAAPPRGPEAAA